ncbi:DUF819 domain-containing protein [Caldisalinibacter kiritimatiensis]|uniref:DUF819 domain-containing protein n=1 Tax=Caldisalinibacter kiritimatiensis TaxID=1304284 RepID=R1AX52_9FIRM|nr:DUF819 family protein [Caldisalinibacter kiritimatiensis]EOD01793.1 DUF819 domain-containing protein [Caldisalinibacter kiritimatiensis]
MNNTLISPDNTWILWAILTGWAAISIWLEQKYKWASKVTGAIIALIGAMVLANLNVIPTSAPAYDQVWTYVVPLAIPLLLFKADVRKIWKESGRVLIIFLISAIGTMIGSFVGFILLKNAVPDLYRVGAMMTGSYIGGGVNFVAMAQSFEAPGELVSAAVVSDNLLMALYFFVLIAIPSMAFFRKAYKHPHVDEVEKHGINEKGKTLAASYWGRKEISLKDIAFAAGSAFAIVAVSGEIAKFFGAVIPTTNKLSEFFNILLGNKYLIMTTLTMLLATFIPQFFGNIRGAQEIGTFLIYIFFVVIGVPASIPLIIQKSPLLLVFCAIMVFFNMVVTLGFGKLFKFDLEEILLASNANIGGPTTAAAMAIAKGWTKLIIPILLVGTLGYVIGNYFGIFMGTLFQGMM